MTTDLRKQVVEAMAQAMSPFGGKSFNMLTNLAQEQLRRQAVAALDAALDVLGERVGSWLDLANPPISAGLAVTVDHLVAALRVGNK